jgi:hypothetical protein
MKWRNSEKPSTYLTRRPPARLTPDSSNLPCKASASKPKTPPSSTWLLILSPSAVRWTFKNSWTGSHLSWEIRKAGYFEYYAERNKQNIRPVRWRPHRHHQLQQHPKSVEGTRGNNERAITGGNAATSSLQRQGNLKGGLLQYHDQENLLKWSFTFPYAIS